MEILKVTPRGYCKGVVRAIQIAKETKANHPHEDVYILGMLVHNDYVMQGLNALGIITLDDTNKSREALLEEIDHGVVIFTAHGVSQQVRDIALKKQLIVVDASCQDVLRTHSLVNSKLNQGHRVFYIGKKGHPEAQGVCGNNPNISLISTIQDIPLVDATQPIFVTNQTTMSIYDIQSLFDEIKQRYPNAVFADELCSATRVRQEAIANLDQDIDLLIIVGDKKSNNSKKLYEIGHKPNIKACLLIDSVNDLDIPALQKLGRIAISSGASTPTYLTNQVIACLKDNISEKQAIDIHYVI